MQKLVEIWKSLKRLPSIYRMLVTICSMRTMELTIPGTGHIHQCTCLKTVTQTMLHTLKNSQIFQWFVLDVWIRKLVRKQQKKDVSMVQVLHVSSQQTQNGSLNFQKTVWKISNHVSAAIADASTSTQSSPGIAPLQNPFILDSTE